MYNSGFIICEYSLESGSISVCFYVSYPIYATCNWEQRCFKGNFIILKSYHIHISWHFKVMCQLSAYLNSYFSCSRLNYRQSQVTFIIIIIIIIMKRLEAAKSHHNSLLLLATSDTFRETINPFSWLKYTLSLSFLPAVGSSTNVLRSLNRLRNEFTNFLDE